MTQELREAALDRLTGPRNGSLRGTREAVPDFLPAQNVVRIAAGGDACSPGIGAGGVWLKLT